MAKKKNCLDRFIDEFIEKSEFNRHVIAIDLTEAAGIPCTYENRELRQAIAKEQDGIDRRFYEFDLKTNEKVLEIMEQNPKAVKKAYRKQVIAANHYELSEIPSLLCCMWGRVQIFSLV